MECRRFGAKLLVRLDKGEELQASIKKLCRDHGIKLAAVSGIGATNKVKVGIFEQPTKRYHTREYVGSIEITALTGNISTFNGEIYAHLHVTLTGEDYSAFGGHLNELWVGPTFELIIDVIEGSVDREFSPEIGLNLLKYSG